jgi:phosphoribosylamine--glycine ligase
MITPDGPKVVEFNSRFGDPETQVVLPLYGGDLVDLILASCDETISPQKAHSGEHSTNGSSVCVVLASGGYPDKYQTGRKIDGLQNLAGLNGVVAFHAGTKRLDDAIVTAGGRVLGITAISTSSDIEQTIKLAYDGIRRISFEGMHYRRDIGRKALVYQHAATIA